ncbi:MAG: hypothetical protein ACRCZO_00965 [Cetobacterium sp.]|uniref:hypothetical protein n=1 Tax=Cetobacterium sp. TaxID=2071632 RepID=UPI003F31B5D0
MNLNLLFKNLVLDSMICLCIFEKMKRKKSITILEISFYYSIVVNSIYPDRPLNKTYFKFQDNIKDVLMILFENEFISVIELDKFKLSNNTFKITDIGIKKASNLQSEYFFKVKSHLDNALKEYSKINMKILKKVVYDENN